MDCVKCITNGIDLNRKMAKAVLFGAITAGVTAGAYVGIRKIAQLVEDKRLARYYEDEIEEIFNRPSYSYSKKSHIKVAYFILCKYKTIIEYAIIKLRFSDDIK